MCNNINCIKEGALSCGRCGVAKYCSKSCQTQDWKLHKLTCGQTATLQKPLKDITKQLRDAIKHSDYTSANKLKHELDTLCSDNRDGVIDLDARMSPNLSPNSNLNLSYDKLPLSVMRNDTQNSLEELLVTIDKYNKNKLILDNKKLEIEDIISHFAKYGFEKSEECLEYKKQLAILECQITEIDDRLIIYNELEGRMKILIRDIYTVPMCITCRGIELIDNTIYRCKVCRMAHYCSEACIMSDALEHKKSCKEFFK
jgi:hypothetical protein